MSTLDTTTGSQNPDTGLLVELRKRNERLNILSDIAGMLLLNDDPREIIDAVFDRLSAHLGLEAYFNYLLTEDGTRMRLTNYRGIPPETAREIEWLDFGQAVCGCVARDKSRIIAEDVQHSDDRRTDLIRSLGITAYCCHPLIAQGKLIGTLSFGTKKRLKFSHDEIELLYISCNHVATALDRYNLIRQLQKATVELERRVEDRTKDLQKANSALRDSNRSLEAEIAERIRVEAKLREAKHEAEVYLDLMGHDISNIHQVILGNLEMALEASDAPVDDMEQLETSMWAVKRSVALIDNVQKLRKMQSGEIEPENVDLSPVLKAVVDRCRATKDAIIRTDIPEGSYPVIANRMLPEVFLALVENAVKHSRRNNVDILISMASVNEGGRLYHRVAVEDNGRGIPDDLKQKILHRFQPGDNYSKGIGLGLYLVRSMVESYRGKVWVEDRVPGDYTQGSRFVVLLPALS